MTDWPVHGKIDGPIVMIGFGSIGTRHAAADRAPFRVSTSRASSSSIPIDNDRDAARRARHPLHPEASSPGELPRAADAAAHRRAAARASASTSRSTPPRSTSWNCAARLGALYIDTVIEPWLGFYFDKPSSARRRARTTRCAKTCSPRKRTQARRPDGRVLLRRQSRHGVLVRQAGAAQPRRATLGAQVQRAEDARGLGAS